MTSHTSGIPTSAPRGSLDDALVMFDWNGTLIADVTRASKATNDVLRAHGLPAVTEKAFRERFRLPLEKLMSDLGVPSDRHAAAQRAWNAGMIRRAAPLRAGATDVVEALTAAGALVGVVSAADAASITADLDRAGAAGVRLRRWLTRVDGGVADKVRRLRGFRGQRERAIYIGDTEYDIESARRAGYIALAIEGGYRSRERLQAAQPDAIIGTLAELPPLICDFPHTAHSPARHAH